MAAQTQSEFLPSLGRTAKRLNRGFVPSIDRPKAGYRMTWTHSLETGRDDSVFVDR